MKLYLTSNKAATSGAVRHGIIQLGHITPPHPAHSPTSPNHNQHKQYFQSRKAASMLIRIQVRIRNTRQRVKCATASFSSAGARQPFSSTWIGSRVLPRPYNLTSLSLFSPSLSLSLSPPLCSPAKNPHDSPNLNTTTPSLCPINF